MILSSNNGLEQVTHLHQTSTLFTAPPPSAGLPRNPPVGPSYSSPWQCPRLFYHPVTEEGRGRWGRRVTYEKRGRGGWGEEEVVAVLTMALTRKPRHTPHYTTPHHTPPHPTPPYHTTPPQLSTSVGMVINGSWINGYDSTDEYLRERSILKLLKFQLKF